MSALERARARRQAAQATAAATVPLVGLLRLLAEVDALPEDPQLLLGGDDVDVTGADVVELAPRSDR